MKTVAIRQAEERLKRAREALAQMEKAQSFTSIEKPWSDFLQAASAVYSKLEQGAKGCPTSQSWYGRKKHDRKKDKLLSYLHHARNTDYHGLSGTTLQYTEVKVLNDKVQGLKLELDSEGNSILKPVGEGAEIEIIKRHCMLKAVTDERYGDRFMPPTEHLGQPLPPEPNALDVARLGLAYLERLFSESIQLPQLP
jgi:hypothetical protein